jgi:hypothetical protein
MPVIHDLDPVQGASACREMAQDMCMTPQQWQDYCQRRGVLAVVAEQDGVLVGWAVAESGARFLHVRRLEGHPQACRLLLDRLVRLAGERDLTGWVWADRPELQRLFVRLGFVRQAAAEVGGRPASFYFWDRNSEL